MTTQKPQFSLTIQLFQAENGFVLTATAIGASKQFIAKDFTEAKSLLSNFIGALENPET